MAKATVKKQVTILLSLGEKEAEWLRDYTQNCPSLSSELPEEKKIRQTIFDILDYVLRNPE